MIKKRIKKYVRENFGEVLHTTLNPEGPGVVRIHLIPPKVDGDDFGKSVAIINGQDIIPIGISWTILLAEFIKEVNKFSDREVNDDDINLIMKRTVKDVRKVYPMLSKKLIKEDIYIIMNTFKQIAYREDVDASIGYMRLGDYAPYMRAPHRMDLMVSAMTKEGKWHCNQKCVHCYAAGQENAEEEELSTNEWMDIIDKCKLIGIPQLTFTGGEPTMRDDLLQLIKHASWFVTRLNTNGIKLSKEYCEQLRKVSLDSVQITFYSEDKDIHNQLVGADKFDETLAGIDNAIEAGLSVSINTPLCTLNKDYVKTLKFLHDRGVIYVTCSGLITTGNATTDKSEKMQLGKEEIKEVLKAAVDYCYENGMEINFTSPGWIEASFFDELGIVTPSCGACLSNMAITPSGNIVPCQSWLSGRPLGNILEDNWEDIWNNEECMSRRDYSAKMEGKCPLRRLHEN